MKVIIKHIFIFFTVIYLLVFNNELSAKAVSDVDWLLLKENTDGKQWIDLGSFKRFKNNEISVLTKYYSNPSDNESKGTTSLYTMRINCDTNNYKDTSVNGIPKFKAKWESSNNDELIDIVIEKACNKNNP